MATGRPDPGGQSALSEFHGAIRWMKAHGKAVIGWGLGSPRRPAAGHTWEAIGGRFLHQFDGLITYSQKGAEEYARLDLP